MEMGVFTALSQDGSSKTADSLAQELGVDKDLLGEFQYLILIFVTVC